MKKTKRVISFFALITVVLLSTSSKTESTKNEDIKLYELDILHKCEVYSESNKQTTVSQQTIEVVHSPPPKEKVKKKKAVNKWHIKFTKSEIKVLERLVEAEATDKSIKAKENVCSVILNRVKDKTFPNTITKVAFAKSQFSCISDRRYYKVKIRKSTKKAVKNVIKNGRTTKALYFFSMKDIDSVSIKGWINRDLKFLFKDDGGHSFYIERCD